MRVVLFFCSLLLYFPGNSQVLPAPLTVEKIMQDPKWIGTSPSGSFWDHSGNIIYFKWNPDRSFGDSLYMAQAPDWQINKVPFLKQPKITPAGNMVYAPNKQYRAYQRDGDIYFSRDDKSKFIQITRTIDHEFLQEFTTDSKFLIYKKANDLFTWEIETGAIVQKTFHTSLKKEKKSSVFSAQDSVLKREQRELFDVLEEIKNREVYTEKYKKLKENNSLFPTFYESKDPLDHFSLSPDNRSLLVVTNNKTENKKPTSIPHFVTESGFTESFPAREKVGYFQQSQKLWNFIPGQDTFLQFEFNDLPGIGYKWTYSKNAELRIPDTLHKKNRDHYISGIQWSPTGKMALVNIYTTDKKDRYIVIIYPGAHKYTMLDHQQNGAWIGGPGSYASNGTQGWLSDEIIWFQSEKTGYSHIYKAFVSTANIVPVTQGNFEIQKVIPLKNKHQFYYIANDIHPGKKRLHLLDIITGRDEVVIDPNGGMEEVSLSPDEKYISYKYSTPNIPWELYIKEVTAKSKPRQITTLARSQEFKEYPWRVPEIINVPARDGKFIISRLYRPENPDPKKPAVIFVHGAGYLQNAHFWWSSYFREYMFHNLLADHGYTVLDMDYRASSGYGRDWRTGIYRHMGGQDLDDNLDGATFLADSLGIDPKRIGIYGGSYGGFITLMALFTRPGVFAAGAALRPVTDWAHYNHGYTSNILNTPVEDSLAFRRSSPIYFAEGLQDHLLICHGMIDDNVHFQDVVRLQQRLIELGKKNWEVAAYPLEGHAFVWPSSWTDEYRRIFELFEKVLKK